MKSLRKPKGKISLPSLSRGILAYFILFVYNFQVKSVFKFRALIDRPVKSELLIVSYAAVFSGVTQRSPHKRLLKTEPHSFPFVFAVNRNNQSRLGKLTMTLILGRKKTAGGFPVMCRTS